MEGLDAAAWGFSNGRTEGQQDEKPLLGFRIFKIHQEPGYPPRLFSANAGDEARKMGFLPSPYEWDQKYKIAYCTRTIEHHAPDRDCHCGVYAFHSLTRALCVTHKTLWRHPTDVIAAVTGVGNYFSHEEGWRAGEGEIVAFAGFGPEFEGMMRAQRIANRLGVEIVPLEELNERAKAFGVVRRPYGNPEDDFHGVISDLTTFITGNLDFGRVLEVVKNAYTVDYARSYDGGSWHDYDRPILLRNNRVLDWQWKWPGPGSFGCDSSRGTSKGTYKDQIAFIEEYPSLLQAAAPYVQDTRGFAHLGWLPKHFKVLCEMAAEGNLEVLNEAKAMVTAMDHDGPGVD